MPSANPPCLLGRPCSRVVLAVKEGQSEGFMEKLKEALPVTSFRPQGLAQVVICVRRNYDRPRKKAVSFPRGDGEGDQVPGRENEKGPFVATTGCASASAVRRDYHFMRGSGMDLLLYVDP